MKFEFLVHVGKTILSGLASGLRTSNIDLSTVQRIFLTDQRKSGLPKVLPAYKNGLNLSFGLLRMLAVSILILARVESKTPEVISY